VLPKSSTFFLFFGICTKYCRKKALFTNIYLRVTKTKLMHQDYFYSKFSRWLEMPFFHNPKIQHGSGRNKKTYTPRQFGLTEKASKK
jgi:hypothetical protein